MFQVFKSGIIRVLFLCSLTFTAIQLHGQIQHLNFRHYSLADGLSSYKVVKILQDRFGFMWIATQDGLNRFDGKDIIIYNKSSVPKHMLAGNDITGIQEDTSRNILWVISSYGGLNGIDLKTGNVKYAITVADPASHFNHGWLKCIALYKNEVWIGTFDGIAIYNPDEGRFKKNIPIPFKKNNDNNYDFDVNLFYTDEYDRVWAFIANHGLVLYSGIDHSVISFYDLSVLHLPGKYEYKRFNSTQKIAHGGMLLATHAGIKRISYNNTGSLKIADEKIPGADGKEIRSLGLDRDGKLWFATGVGLFKCSLYDRNSVTIKDVNQLDQKKWLSSINSVFFDNKDNVWLGTLQGFALSAITNTRFLNYFQSTDLKAKINRAFFIFPVNDSAEYVCADDGFFQVDNSSGNIKQLKGGMAFSFIYQHPDGNKIVSAENQLFIFHPPGKFTEIDKVYPELSEIKNETINSAVSWNDSLIFMGSESGNGVYEWNYKKKRVKKIDSKSPAPLKSDIVNTVYRDKENRIWILSDNSFAIYDPGSKKIENYELGNSITGQPLNLFFDVCENSGSFWLASYGSGIVQLDKNCRIKKIISVDQGMANAGVYKIFPVNDTLLYTTSNNGLCRINILNNSISNYFEQDGLHSNAFEESCGIYSNGKIYAGGPNGFTIIDPAYFTTNNIPPRLYINRMVIKTRSGLTDTSDLFLQSMKIPNNVLQSTVYFSGLNYSNPEKTTYTYRIKEQHSEWISLGNHNTFPLTGLSPGVYTLQVKAVNENGAESEPAELEITFLPKWYQTWWFYSLAAIIVLTGIYILFRYRLMQRIKLLEMRSHISQDLHDEIGSSISGINLLSQVAVEKLHNNKPDEASEYLIKVKNYTQDVIEKLGDMVWVLTPQNDSIEKLMQRIKSFTISIAASKNIKIHFVTGKESETMNLTLRQRKAIYLISKEAVNNIFKYAECRNVYFSLNGNGSKWQLSIRDDGKGFTPTENSSGNGIKNMQARAEEIKAGIKINSEPGKGTTIELEL